MNGKHFLSTNHVEVFVKTYWQNIFQGHTVRSKQNITLRQHAYSSRQMGITGKIGNRTNSFSLLTGLIISKNYTFVYCTKYKRPSVAQKKKKRPYVLEFQIHNNHCKGSLTICMYFHLSTYVVQPQDWHFNLCR